MQPSIPSPPSSCIRHIAVVIPAHNEQDSIADCLTAVERAVQFLQRGIFSYIKITIIVVLDSCRDDTQTIVEKMAEKIPYLIYLTCEYRCVGQVRKLGIRHAIMQSADWIACTDADSQVSEDWLVAQLEHLHDDLTDKPYDMICGVVSIDNWAHLSKTTKEKYLAHYQDRMGHRHIHGANLCFLASSYQKVGGFSPMPCHEDVDLVKKFKAHLFTIVWSNRVRVNTSSRLDARAAEGFAHFLANLQQESGKT